jgi:hypothetical protein
VREAGCEGGGGGEGGGTGGGARRAAGVKDAGAAATAAPATIGEAGGDHQRAVQGDNQRTEPGAPAKAEVLHGVARLAGAQAVDEQELRWEVSPAGAGVLRATYVPALALTCPEHEPQPEPELDPSTTRARARARTQTLTLT